MTNRQKTIIDMYFIEKLKPVEIATKLEISKSAVTQVLKKDERYYEEKQLRKVENHKRNVEETKIYKDKKRKEIEFSNAVDKSTLENLHDQDVAELSYKNKLSDMAYRNWNTSAYTYDEDKKRFAFREELGRSADVPRYIKVEV